jgi:hypothetical protein
MKTFKQFCAESHAATFQGMFTKKLVDSSEKKAEPEEKKKKKAPEEKKEPGLSDSQKKHLDAFRKKGVMNE